MHSQRKQKYKDDLQKLKVQATKVNYFRVKFFFQPNSAVCGMYIHAMPNCEFDLLIVTTIRWLHKYLVT